MLDTRWKETVKGLRERERGSSTVDVMLKGSSRLEHLIYDTVDVIVQ